MALTACLAVAALGQSGPIVVTIDSSNPRPISPWIYGTNMADFPNEKGRYTLVRLGGNRWTAYNWTNNASNAGTDWFNQNDGYLEPSDTPGEAVRKWVEPALAADASAIVTVPIAGYVAADKNGDGDVNQTPDFLNVRFRKSWPSRAVQPNPGPTDVVQEDLVEWVEGRFPAAHRPSRPLFYSLDNEPDLWVHTHQRIRPDGAATYAEMAQRTEDYARAIKAKSPNGLVIGPVSYGWYGFRTLQDAPDAGGRDFLDFYLSELAAMQTRAQRRLVDVLDLHWYPEAQSEAGVRIVGSETDADTVTARVQAPRSLWDPNYTERSWITQWDTGGPIRLIPRMLDKIAAGYPGTHLGFSEYTYGAADHISGGVAQADALGVFGREGVFLACVWWLQWPDQRFGRAAFDLYRNYDQTGLRFGEASLAASSSDVAKVAGYASQVAGEPGRWVAVLVNRSTNGEAVQLDLPRSFATMRRYQLTEAIPSVVPVASSALAGDPTLNLPAMSASTVELFRPTPGRGVLAVQEAAPYRFGAWLTEAGRVTAWKSLGAVAAGWRAVAVGDIDGDRRNDLLVQRTSDRTLGCYLLRDGRVVGWRNLGKVGTGWEVRGAGDLDRDGKGDVLVWRASDGSTGVYRTNGSAIVAWTSLPKTGVGWSPASWNDFDGDARLDLLLAGPTGQLGVWRMNGSTVLGWRSLSALPSGWVLDGVVDVEPDGDPDLLLRRTSDGRLGARVMDGFAITGWASLTSVGSGWRVVGGV